MSSTKFWLAISFVTNVNKAYVFAFKYFVTSTDDLVRRKFLFWNNYIYICAYEVYLSFFVIDFDNFSF